MKSGNKYLPCLQSVTPLRIPSLSKSLVLGGSNYGLLLFESAAQQSEQMHRAVAVYEKKEL